MKIRAETGIALNVQWEPTNPDWETKPVMRAQQTRQPTLRGSWILRPVVGPESFLYHLHSRLKQL